MDYTELFSRTPSVQNVGFNSDSYKPGLEGMRALDASLGNPSKKFRSVHIAGTNGKGSVSSMLAAALSSLGLKVGLYTSPHLVDFRERIKIIENGSARMIPEERVESALAAMEMDGRSFFEITTALAFLWFAEEKVDFAVIEAGLGGRLDSTNIICPELSVVTSIGLDHCALLGDSRAKIAAEKAGIFKPGIPALVWGHDEETDAVFREHSEIVSFADEIFPEAPDSSELDLQGPCQEINLRTVAAALKILFPTRGIEDFMDAIRNTARITDFHGRWERCGRMILDIGHNPQALKINFERLRGRKLTLVYGVMADKDYETALRMMPKCTVCVLTSPDSPRALKIRPLLDAARRVRPDIWFEPSESVADAVHKAEKLAGDEDTIYIGGSAFVVSEALIYLEKMKPVIPTKDTVLSHDIEDYPGGIILPIDKPYRWTSADVIRKVKWLAVRHFGKKNLKVGHAGTLDPLATGLLLVCIGKATKLAQTLQDHEKEYLAGVSFGATTASYDLEKDIDRIFPKDGITKESIEAMLPGFIGEQMQVAPLFSAKSVDGVRAYETARKLYKEGRMDEAGDLLSASKITITSLKLESFSDHTITPPPALDPNDTKAARINVADISGADLIQTEIRVGCSKGTYIRALARDFGEAMGSGAFLHSLRRTKTGAFKIEDALSIDDLFRD